MSDVSNRERREIDATPSQGDVGLIRVPFHGDEILALDVDGKPQIILKPALESIGLDYWAQIRKLREHSWATTASKAVVAADGKLREMLVCDVRTFLMLLATVDERRVAKDVAPKLIAYQAEVADAIEAYWTKGVAVNPRVSHEEAAKVISIFAAAKIGDAGYWDTKARQLTGRVLGESPEYDQAAKPLTVGTYLTARGVTGKQLRALSPVFGKVLKAKYIAQYGTEPPTIEDLVNRHMVKVAQYREEHRPLFDAVHRELIADAA